MHSSVFETDAYAIPPPRPIYLTKADKSATTAINGYYSSLLTFLTIFSIERGPSSPTVLVFLSVLFYHVLVLVRSYSTICRY